MTRAEFGSLGGLRGAHAAEMEVVGFLGGGHAKAEWYREKFGAFGTPLTSPASRCGGLCSAREKAAVVGAASPSRWSSPHVASSSAMPSPSSASARSPAPSASRARAISAACAIAISSSSKRWKSFHLASPPRPSLQRDESGPQYFSVALAPSAAARPTPLVDAALQ